MLYYLRNGQGDIVKLIDGTGAAKVEYSYDSWGKKLSCTGTLATTLGKLNPFRYRGYVYDEETGFYYLKSRYYDPETCRFISADVYLSTGQGVLGHNTYVYCGNNPIARIDSEGEFWNVIAGAVLGAVIGAVTAAINGESGADIAKSAVIGAATGAIAGASLGIGLAVATPAITSLSVGITASAVGTVAGGATIAAVGGAVSGGVGSIATQLYVGKEEDRKTWSTLDRREIASSAINGAVSNVVSFGVTMGAVNMSNVVYRPNSHRVDIIKTMANNFHNATVADYVLTFGVGNSAGPAAGFSAKIMVDMLMSD